MGDLFEVRFPSKPFPSKMLETGPMEVSRSVLGALLEERGESRDNEFALRWFKQYMHRLLEDVERANAERERARRSEAYMEERAVQVARENEFLKRGIEAYRQTMGEASHYCQDETTFPIPGCESCLWEAEARERE